MKIYQELSERYNPSEEKSNLSISSASDPRFKSLPFLSPEDTHQTFTTVGSKAAALKGHSFINPLKAQLYTLKPLHVILVEH